MENEIYKKVFEIVENCMFEMGYIMRPHADETDDFLIELEKDLNEKLPLPSVSREKAVPLSKFASIFRRNDYSSSAQIIKSDYSGNVAIRASDNSSSTNAKRRIEAIDKDAGHTALLYVYWKDSEIS